MTEQKQRNRPDWRRKGPDGKWLGKPKPAYAPKWRLEDMCLPQQLAFINDPAPFVTACCSRRAGKTFACARDLVNTAIRYNNVVCGYITLTARLAKRIIWRELEQLNTDYELGAVFNKVELTMTFPNGSIIYVSGCSDASEVDKFLGVPLKLLYLDEAQAFKSFIADLLDRAIGPALLDHQGSLKLIGTPGFVKNGYFWDAIDNKEFTHHSWTYWDNTYLPFLQKGITHEQALDRVLKQRGVDINDPTIQREYFGRWVVDDKARVFLYDPTKNNFMQESDLANFVIGVDIGFHDADAIAVIGWRNHDKTAYLEEEIVVPQQGVTELAEQLETLIKRYNPMRVVMDTGGLGRKIAEELRKRFALPIVAAEKTRKQEYIELLNDAMRTERFKARKKSRFATDSFIVEWDQERSTPDRRVVKADPHSDICDAVLYGFRESLHWLEDAKKEKRVINSRADWVKYSQQLAEENLQKQIDQQNEDKSFQMQMDAMFAEEDPVNAILNRRKK